MNIDQLARHLVEGFFSGEINQITLEKVREDKDLSRWVDRLLNHQAPTVLPLWPLGSKTIWWHGIARTEPELRQLYDGLQAFLGPTYADLTQARTRVKTDHPIGRLLYQYSQGRVIRFQADPAHVRQALNRMFDVWDAQPARANRDTRSPGVLRRAFDVALRTRDALGALEALASLRDTGTLSATNDLFLQVQYLSAFERWDDLLHMEALPDLLALRRPMAVTEALLRAVYYIYLAPALREDDLDTVRTVFREQVMPQYQPLLEASDRMKTPEALLVAAVAAAEAGDAERLGSLAQRLTAEGDLGSDLLIRLQEDLATETPVVAPKADAIDDPLALASEAVKHNEMDKAIRWLREAPPSRARTVLMLQVAVLVQSLEATREALTAFYNLPEADLQTLRQDPLVQRYLERLQPEESERSSGHLPPDSWHAWLDRLLSDPDWSQAEIRRTAELGAYEWSHESLLGDASPEEVAAHLSAIPNHRIDIFAEVMPKLVATLQDDPAYPNPEFTPIYLALLEHLVFLDAPTLNDVRLYVDMLPSVLVQRLTRKDYAEVIDNVIGMVERLHALPPPTLLLDLVDALVVYPCRDPEARLRAVTVTVNAYERYKDRWSSDEVRFLRQLCRELEQEDLAQSIIIPSAREYVDPLTLLDGKYVAIYTLNEKAAQRAEQFIKDVAPKVRIEINHDKVATEALKTMARNADYFIMVTSSAKHAATTYIETYRGDRPLIRPAGQGSASLLRDLRAYLKQS
ncbi:MAG: hypothetical protein KatS3mg015_2428 [Fimbriimonadales bacterium]|nr:MAG: hypothetical protein KatS3mg015_2428 [Fimbriimonadales bacterium]